MERSSEIVVISQLASCPFRIFSAAFIHLGFQRPIFARHTLHPALLPLPFPALAHPCGSRCEQANGREADQVQQRRRCHPLQPLLALQLSRRRPYLQEY